MILSKAHIQQFRSIKDLEISFEPSCRVLIGINETGKSNILKALSLLSNDRNPVEDDVRQVPGTEPEPTESSVEFTFSAESEDCRLIAEMLKKKIAGLDTNPIVVLHNEDLSPDQLIVRFTKDLFYYVDVKGQRKFPRYISPSSAISIPENILVASDRCPETHSFRTDDGNVIKVADYALFSKDIVLPEHAETLFRPATLEDVQKIYGSIVTEYTEKQIPDCVLWTFNEDSVLPASINLPQFLSNPSLHPAIENMFNIAGIEDIKNEVEFSKKKANGMRTLLERVGINATKYIQNIWEDFSELSIELHEQGNNLEIIIRDEFGPYYYDRRSDGFRRFVGFILRISAKINSGKLSKALLLYDEPDTSLHPSGAKQLRNELIKLSQSNPVVYSTHSIFMVDPECLERHLIVSKEKEITNITTAESSNLRNEEVLYNAIGYSIFDVLGKTNLILEGYKDKVIVDLVLSRDSDLNKHFAEVGICYAGGVKNIPNITPTLQLAGKDCLIITDSDQPAIERQKAYEGHGKWCTYSELLEEDIETAEDFLDFHYIITSINKLAESNIPELKDISKGMDASKPVLRQLSKILLSQKKVGKERKKDIEHKLKEDLFQNLRFQQLKPVAVQLVEQIKIKLTQL